MLTQVPWRIDIGGDSLEYLYIVDSEGSDSLAWGIAEGTWRPSPAMLWLLGALEPGDRVLDIGAHIGSFSMAAAARGAHLLAVEASAANVKLLRAAVSANAFEHVEVLHRAVDSSPGYVEFDENGPFGSIAVGQPPIRGHTTWVEATTLDALPGRPYAWAKVDIEGAEVRALASGHWCLQELRGLVIESNGHVLRENGTSPQALVALLRDEGFGVFEARGTDLVALRPQFIQPETTVDYVAVRGEPVLPAGWRQGTEPAARAIVSALARELDHSLPGHRSYARDVVAGLPRRVRRQVQRARQQPPALSRPAGSFAGVSALPDGGLLTCTVEGAVHRTVPGGPPSLDQPGPAVTAPVVGMAATASGDAYWLASADGNVYAVGKAAYFGSMAGQPLNAPVVGIAAAPDDGGYWLVAADGGVFAFGSGSSFGSLGGRSLSSPIAAFAPSARGEGYWLSTADATIYPFGGAPALAATGPLPPGDRVVGMTTTPSGLGCWIATDEGEVRARSVMRAHCPCRPGRGQRGVSPSRPGVRGTTSCCSSRTAGSMSGKPECEHLAGPDQMEDKNEEPPGAGSHRCGVVSPRLRAVPGTADA